MSIITLATDVAVMRVTGYANRYREKTSIAVIIWSYRWVVDLVECPFEECLQGRDPILGN